MRFAQALQARLEIADLASHVAYIPVDLTGGNAALFDELLENVMRLTGGKRGT